MSDNQSEPNVKETNLSNLKKHINLLELADGVCFYFISKLWR